MENNEICIICGFRATFSKGDNVCQHCIDEFLIIDKATLPPWLKEFEIKYARCLVEDLREQIQEEEGFDPKDQFKDAVKEAESFFEKLKKGFNEMVG